jgi:hypothetical protein
VLFVFGFDGICAKSDSVSISQQAFTTAMECDELASQRDELDCQRDKKSGGIPRLVVMVVFPQASTLLNRGLNRWDYSMN